MPNYTFETPHPVALTVKNLGGKVVIQATDDGTTTVELTGAHADEATVTQLGGAINVTAPHCDWLDAGMWHNWLRRNRIDITVTAPQDSDVTLQLGGGETQILGRFGRLEVRPGAGEVHVTDANGETSVHLGAGNVNIDSISARTRVINGAGNIHIGQASGDVKLQLGTGDVSIDAMSGPVRVKNGAGSVKIGDVTGDLTVDSGVGSTSIERISSGRFTYKGSGGDVKIGVANGTPTWTELSTVVGRVTNNLPSVGEPQPGQDHVELRVSTVSGAITLRPV